MNGLVWLKLVINAMALEILRCRLLWLQRTPQAQRPAFKTPALQSFGRTPYTGA